MKALIVIDMQNDFIDGALGTKEAVAIVPRVKQKIEEYQKRGDKIIFTRDTHRSDYLERHEGKMLPIPHCIYGTDGWMIPETLDVPDCRYIDKDTFGWPFWGNNNTLSVFEPDMEIVGLCTDICVVSNALILRSMYPECDITVDASCCAGTTPEKHMAALEVMKSCQINIINE